MSELRLGFYLPLAPLIRSDGLYQWWSYVKELSGLNDSLISNVLLSPHWNLWSKHIDTIERMLSTKHLSTEIGHALVDVVCSGYDEARVALLRIVLKAFENEEGILWRIALEIFCRIEWAPSIGHFINILSDYNHIAVARLLAMRSLSKPFWIQYPGAIKQFIDTKLADVEVIKFVLTQKQWHHNPHLVLDLMRNQTAGRQVYRYLLHEVYQKDETIEEYFEQLKESENVEPTNEKTNRVALPYQFTREILMMSEFDLPWMNRRFFGIGDIVELPGSHRQYTVVSINNDGHTAYVYQIQPIIQGNDEFLMKRLGLVRYALKIARWPDRSLYLSIRSEAQRDFLLRELWISHASVVEYGRDYLIKEWITGERGDEWYGRWVLNGSSPHDPAFISLVMLFSSLINRATYVMNLKGVNMIWCGNIWNVIDPGPVFFIEDRHKIENSYFKCFDERWVAAPPNKMLKAPPIRSLLNLQATQ